MTHSPTCAHDRAKAAIRNWDTTGLRRCLPPAKAPRIPDSDEFADVY